MVPPIWPDEHGRPLPTYPCRRPGCGREVAVRFRGYRIEHLRDVRWARLEQWVSPADAAEDLLRSALLVFEN